MRVTIKDIAARAGVSKTAVSFAFNDPSKISKETYEKIMAIAEEIGYVPDPLARTLTTKRIGTIGFLLPQPISEAFKNPYFFELLQGIGSVCHGHGFSLTIIPPIKDSIAAAVKKAVVDGFLTVGVGPDMKIVELIRQRHIPFVTVDGESSERISNVGIDDRGSARELMRYVLSLGHERIAVVAVRTATLNLPEESYSRVREMRLKGFADALEERGFAIDDRDRVLLLESESSVEGGRTAGNELASAILRGGQAATDTGSRTAVVCMSDIIAHGIYEAFRNSGISVPETASVVGFDDIDASRLLTPGLTTVHQPGFDKGRRASELLFRQMNGDARIEHVELPTRLIVRASARSLP